MKKINYLAYLIILCCGLNLFASDLKVNKIQADYENSLNKIEINAQVIPLQSNIKILQSNKIQIKENNYLLDDQDVLATVKSKMTIFENSHRAYIIDTDNNSLELIENDINFSETVKQAIEISPKWLREQLLIKFKFLKSKDLDSKFAQLILDADDKYKDEVAFVIAYSSINTLTNARFMKDINVIIRNAELIYAIADSLKYVKLVEYGSLENRDYYTTTTYRIFDSEKNDTIWSEIPKEIYYFYLVHFKLDQEGVFVADDPNSSEERTYGYFWRDYIWNNPDPENNYMPMNVKTTKGEMKSIPRFGELMQMPTILWDRKETYYKFGRELKESDNALDLIGNWGSRALPVNVTLPRSFQPNQILMKHDGMCNEDAFLMAGACRTALIPIIYLGTWAEDHVFGAIWDKDWYHFEFFRGGLEPQGNEAYGITNMMKGGNYGWENSLVNGFRPDGYNINFTKYYANTCNFEVRITDSIGNPIPGTKLYIYAQSGTSILYSGTVFSNSDGIAKFEAGENKIYYVRANHPIYKSAPVDETKVYLLYQYGTKKGNTYKVNLSYSNVKVPQSPVENIEYEQTDPNFNYAVNIKAKTTNILNDLIGKHDSQRSKFFYWNPEEKGEITVFLADEENYNKYINGETYKAYHYNEYKNENDFTLRIPKNGKWYLVLSNDKYDNFYQHIDSEISLLDNYSSVNEVEIENLITLQNQDNLYLNKDLLNELNIKSFELIDTRGKCLLSGDLKSNLINIENLANGVYIINLKSLKSVYSVKFVK